MVSFILCLKETVNPKGYWRENMNSINLFECLPDKTACKGNHSDPSEICASNHIGPLCQTCDKGFSKFGAYECSKCSQFEINVFIITFLLIITLSILAVYVK